MTCKDCLNHTICKGHKKLMLMADENYELVYADYVESLCRGFKKGFEKTERKCGNG